MRQLHRHEWYTASDLVLCRSDTGDGGWSLHAPDADDEDVASGDAPAIISGTAERDSAGEWSRPTAEDYALARHHLCAAETVRSLGLPAHATAGDWIVLTPLGGCLWATVVAQDGVIVRDTTDMLVVRDGKTLLIDERDADGADGWDIDDITAADLLRASYDLPTATVVIDGIVREV